MDPNQAWDEMLIAFATKQWVEAKDTAQALVDWLEADGFAPQPTVGSTTGQFTCQLDAEFSRTVAMAACCHIYEWATQEVRHAS